MKLTLKAFIKKSYFFEPQELASKEAFKTAVHAALQTTWLDPECELPTECLTLVQEWAGRIDVAIDELSPESFPINETYLDVLWMESTDVWDDIDAGNYQSLGELFQSFVNSIRGLE